MKISEIIDTLNQTKDKYGDLTVVSDYDGTYIVKKLKINEMSAIDVKMSEIWHHNDVNEEKYIMIKF